MAIRFMASPAILAIAYMCGGCGNAVSTATEAEPQTTGPGCTDADGDDCEKTDGEGPDTEEGPTKFVVKLGERTTEATKKPWSSWWYPLWQDTLFKGKNGELSTLEKYDTYNATYGRRRTAAAAYERDNVYDPRAASWSGRCDAWALASILEPEPKRTIQQGNLTFTVGDLKALLLETYEKVPRLPLVGARFNGEWNDVYDDVAPDDLHRVLEQELFQKRRAFIIDEDAGPEVWNEPAWKAITRIERDANKEDVVHVHTWLFLASPHVEDRNFVGTIEDSREYTYDLIGHWDGDDFQVKKGRWTDRSQWDHPDYAIVIPERVQRGSFNPQIYPDAVDRILGR